MTKYPRGRDIAVNWTLDLGGRTVDLAACDLSFEYFTGAGSKAVPASEYTIENNILSWTFPAEEQSAYGVYGLRLIATTPDGDELLFRNGGAFEIIHGEVDDENRVLPLESSVETEQEEPEEEEPEEETTIYVSASPIHVEKIPLGSNLTLRWRLLTPGDFDFRLEDCTLNLYYAAAGSGFNIATDYSLSTENGYVLTWNFPAEEQIRYGLYSLLLDVRKDGVKIATLVKDDAFSLVHRKGSIFPDRVLDFESVVTSIGGGALYSLIDVRNDGYSTVYRADGVTPAVTGDLLIYDGALWHAIDAASLPGLSALGNELASLRVTTDGIFARVTDLEGDLGELWLTAREFGVRMNDAEGNIGQLTLTAREFGVRMSDAEGNIGQLSLTAQQFAVRMSDVEGNVGQLSLTAQQFGVRMSDIEGNVGELALTAEQFGVRMTDAEGNIGQLLLTADQFATRISDTEGNVSLLQQTATSIMTRVSDAEGNISTLQQTATSLTSRIQNAEGSISTIAQTAESIHLQVDNQAGDIATLQVSARGITSRVADAEGNISTIEQTASQISSRVTSIEGEFGEGGRVTVAESSIIQQAGLIATKVSQTDYDANNQVISSHFSTIEQTATQIQSRVVAVENEFGEGGRVTVAESSITQQAGLIATKVSQTDYDANNQAISSHFSTIEQTATQIATRVASVESEFGEGGRVSVAESTITQQAGLIATKVSQTEYDENNQAISTRFSSISQTVDSIEQRVQSSEGNITTLTTDVSGIHASVETLSSNLSDYEGFVDGVLDGIQDQIDGAIDTWFYNGTPTLENLPASEWTTAALKNAHLGDVYYDNLTGYAYRFTKEGNTYLWTEITDSAVVDALARARNAQDTADHKRRVFLTTPYTPYDAGDLWVQGHTANNDGTIYRCVNSRASGDFVSTDWELASDLVNQNIMRANFDVLANAIIGTVAEYGSDGKITGETATQFAQTVSNISFSVTKVGSALLPTGIDIANQKITITTDNFFLQGNGVGSDTALQIVYRDNVPKISVANLDVAGLFTTQNWTDARLALYNEAVGAANTYADGVGEDAEEYADNAVSYFNTNVVAPLAGRVGATETDLTTLNAYRTAMLDNMTIIAGGLILSTEMELGTTVNNEWKVYSGISGIYDSTARGGGIAAWYGGPRVDHLANPSATEYAASLFRMDGSGYLASGQLQWGAEGELIIHGQSTETPITIENAVLTQGDLRVTISDLIALKSWFTVESWTDSGGTHYYLKLNSSGTGLEGFVSDGFISAGGLSSGGGSEGASLAAVWASLKTNSDDYANEKINAYHIPIGSGLSVVNGLIVANNAGTVTSVKVGTTTYNPTDGVVSLPAYPTYTPGTGISISSGNVISLDGSEYYSATTSRTANTVLAAPNGSNGVASFRKLVAADIPSLTKSKISDFPTQVGAFTNDVGYWSASSHPTTLAGYGITNAVRYASAMNTILDVNILDLTQPCIYHLRNDVAEIENWPNTTSDYAALADFTTGAAHLQIFGANTNVIFARSYYWTAGGTTIPNWVLLYHSGNSNLSTVPWAASTLTAETSVTAPRFYLNASTYFELDADGYVHLAHPSGKGLYVDGFISAGGVSSGGGASGVDLAAVWSNLTANTGEGLNKVINVAHIPALASISGNLTVSRISDIETWISGKGYLTAHQSLDGYVNALTRTPASGGNYVSAITKSGKTITVTYATLPTSLPASDVYSWAKAETKPSYAFSEITGTASTSQIPTLAISKISGLQTALDGKQPLDADLTAIAGLTGTSGFLKKTAANTWTLDTNTYLTTSSAASTYVSGVDLNGNYLRVTKNGANSDLTIPYATVSDKLQSAQINTEESIVHGGVRAYTGSGSGWTGSITSMQYAAILTFGSPSRGWQIWAQRGAGSLLWRNGTEDATAWSDERKIWDSGNSNLATVNWAANQMTANSFKLASGTPTLTWDSNANAWHLSGNFYADGFISAGGVSSGGGTSGVDLTAVWNNLIANTGEGLNKKIHTAHLPTVTITGTNISGTATYSGTGGSASTLTLNLTAVDTTYSAGTGISLSGTTFSLNVSGAKTALGLKALAYKDSLAASDIPDLSGTYLPLSAGSSKPLTGDLYITGGNGRVVLSGVVQYNYSNTMKLLGPASGSSGDLGWYDGSEWKTVIHSGNYTTFVNTTNFPGLNGNQTITLSGDVSGSGATSISVSIGQGKVTNAMLAGSIENSKLNTIGVAKGGTGLTTWTGAYRLIYSSAATTVTTLAPNTTATRKFLRMLGTGSAGAAPAWDTVTKTDVGLSNVPNWVYTIKDSSTQTFTA